MKFSTALEPSRARWDDLDQAVAWMVRNTQTGTLVVDGDFTRGIFHFIEGAIGSAYLHRDGPPPSGTDAAYAAIGLAVDELTTSGPLSIERLDDEPAPLGAARYNAAIWFPAVAAPQPAFAVFPLTRIA